MYISRLSLYGFKSFLKRSDVHFGPGITCIVGPNGCGKTNIVDAIRWVIGEQKTSVLRADRVTDIIFSGTATKRPLNLADVSLTIHNVTGRIPIQYSEITITRRIYRSGESEYFINKHKCRLKDITDLFIDTGMGPNAYSVIELKMVEDILSEVQEERKRLFEEAAGVNKYRIQRRSTIKKLEETEDDLLRLNDIISEVELKVKNLKRQLRRYEKYQETTEKLIDAELTLASRRVYNIRGKLNSLNNEMKAVKEKFQKVVLQSQSVEEKLQEKQGAITQIEKSLEEENRKLDRKKTERNKVQTENLLLKEQKRSIQQTIARLEKNIQSLKERIENSKKRRLSLEIEYKNTERELGNERENFARLTKYHRETEEKFQESERDIQKLQDEQYTFLRQKTEYDTKHESLKENISQKEKDLKSTKGELENKILLKGKLSKSIEQLKTQIATLKSAINSFTSMKENEAQRYSKLSEEKEILRDQIREKESELDRLTNRVQFYESIIESKEGYSLGLQYVLNNPQEFSGIKGALLDLISVKPGYYLAVESVLKDISTLLVAETKTAAINALEKVSKAGKGKVSIIPLEIDFSTNSGDPIKYDGITPLSGLVKCEQSLKRLKEFLFHNVYCCRDEEFCNLVELEELEGISLVSDAGKLRDANGFYTGGLNSSDSNMLIGRREKIVKLKEKREEAQSQVDTVNANLQKTCDEILISESNKKEAEEKLSNTEKELRNLENQLIREKAEFSQCEDIKRKLEEDIVNTRVALASFKEKFEELNADNKPLGSRIEELDKALQGKREKHNEIKLKLESLTKELQNSRVEAVNLENKYNSIIESRKSNEIILNKLLEEEADSIKEKKLLEDGCVVIDKKVKVSELQLNVLNGEVTGIEEKVKKIGEKHQNLRDDIRKLEREKVDLHYKKERLAEELKEYELKESKYFASENEIKSVLYEKYNKKILENLPDDLPDEREALKKVERYKRNLEVIGMVNMAVKEEYEQEFSRFSFLTEQRDDLIRSEEGLNKVIIQIDEVARNQYIEVFNKIKENFKSTFTIFFNGGEADLRLCANSDPLESNIEILACPSGKKLRSLKMLSAGEKTLTAIALLFAIYQVKPSPFCVLDEVDAPLDDENTKRFTNVLKTFSQNTQFIVVTHNKLTMSIADTLYGVTMGRDGVSQIVSVKLR